MILGEVVVVALEDVPRDAQQLGEGVELVVRLVADEVAPAPALPQPEGVVDQNHRCMLPPHPALEQVAACYDEPHRRYHDRRHLGQVLACVERLLEAVDVPDPDAVRLAALFHDAIYDPGSATNEAESAFLAAQVLTGLEPPARVADVQRLVLATATHEATAPDESVLLDADLAVLGADRPGYLAYVWAIRREFAHVTDQAWRTGRAQVLRSLLSLPRLFSTPPMEHLEPRARDNLRTELVSLDGG